MPGDFDFSGMEREAQDNIGALRDSERKTEAYNALSKAYGPAIAYDPTAAYNASRASVAQRTEGTQVDAADADLQKTQLDNAGTKNQQQRDAASRAAAMVISQAGPDGAIPQNTYDTIVRPNAALLGIDPGNVDALGHLLGQPGGAQHLQNIMQSLLGPTKVAGTTAYGIDANGNTVAITHDQYGNVHQQTLAGTQTTAQQNATTGATRQVVQANQGDRRLNIAQQNADSGVYRANTTANNSLFGNPAGQLPTGGAPAPAAVTPAPAGPATAAPAQTNAAPVIPPNSQFARLPPKGRQQAIGQASQIVNSGTQLATTNQILDAVDKQITPYTAGTGSLLKNLPGSAQADLKANLKTLSAQGLTAWITSLKNSQGQTGIGRVLQSEANAAMTLFGNMEQDQSAKQLAFHAKLFRQTVNKLYQHQQQSFQSMYGVAPHVAAGTEDPMAPKAAPGSLPSGWKYLGPKQ